MLNKNSKTLNIMESKLYAKAKHQLESVYVSYKEYGSLLHLNLNGFSWAKMHDKNTLEIRYEDSTWSVEYVDEVGEIYIEGTDTTHKEGISIIIYVGAKTKSGYFSSKKLPVSFDYLEEGRVFSEKEVEELIEFETDAKKSTFDPFYKENEYKRRNASAWNYIAQNFITDPYDRG